MNGVLGVLYQGGKQVGGIYDWDIDIITSNSTIRNGWYEFKVFKEITAQSYWLNLAPDSDYFEIKFYKAIRGQLVLIDGGKVGVSLPDKTLDRRLHIPLEIRWVSN